MKNSDAYRERESVTVRTTKVENGGGHSAKTFVNRTELVGCEKVLAKETHKRTQVPFPRGISSKHSCAIQKETIQAIDGDRT